MEQAEEARKEQRREQLQGEINNLQKELDALGNQVIEPTRHRLVRQINRKTQQIEVLGKPSESEAPKEEEKEDANPV